MIPNAYFDRFSTVKYRNRNPVQRALIKRFVAKVHTMFVAAQPAPTVLEVGCGEGFLSGYLSERFPEKKFIGVDLNEQDLVELRKRFDNIEAHHGSAYELDFLKDRQIDLLMCCEVLEHLDTPEVALDQFLALSPKHCILTVPHEPWFMLSNFARGKNLTRLGNDPEHINHWTAASFRKLLQSRFEVLEVTTSYPWILALAKPR